MKVMIAAFMTISSLMAMENISVIESYIPKKDPIKLNIIEQYEPTKYGACSICFKEKRDESFKFWPCFKSRYVHGSCYTIMHAIEEPYNQVVVDMVKKWTKKNEIDGRWNCYLINKVCKHAREQLKLDLLHSKETWSAYIEKKDGGTARLKTRYEQKVQDWVSVYLTVSGGIFKIKQERIRNNQKEENEEPEE